MKQARIVDPYNACAARVCYCVSELFACIIQRVYVVDLVILLEMKKKETTSNENGNKGKIIHFSIWQACHNASC